MESLSLLRCLPMSVVVMAILTSCATPTEKSADGAASVSSARTGDSCSESQNLLADIEFQGLDQGTWSYIQHSGPQSFRVAGEQGELELARIGDEPWMLLTQRVTLAELDPDQRYTLEMSAELKGDVQTEPELHGFEHKAGLFIRSGAANMAEHEPNSGVWDWQRVDMSVALLPGSKSVQAGFLHQGGGTLWARAPSLKLVGCDE